MIGFLIVMFFLFLLFLLGLFVRTFFGGLFLGKWHLHSKSKIVQPFSQKKKKISSDKGEYVEYEEIKETGR